MGGSLPGRRCRGGQGSQAQAAAQQKGQEAQKSKAAAEQSGQAAQQAAQAAQKSQEAAEFKFTSSLPVAIIRLLEPVLGPRLRDGAPEVPTERSPTAPLAPPADEPTQVASAVMPAAE